MLADWLGRPHVAPWWREPSDFAAVEAAYGPMIDGSDPTEGFIAVREGQPLAFLQRYRFDDNPHWQRTVAEALADGAAWARDEIRPCAGIDYLIGDQTMTGRGLGRQMIAAFVELTWTPVPRHHRRRRRRGPGQRGLVARALQGADFLRAWAGVLNSDDPSDEGPSYLYVRRRPAA